MEREKSSKADTTLFPGELAGELCGPLICTESRLMWRICIRYLATEEIGRLTSYSIDEELSDIPFLTYPATSWLAHAKQADAEGVLRASLLMNP